MCSNSVSVVIDSCKSNFNNTDLNHLPALRPAGAFHAVCVLLLCVGRLQIWYYLQTHRTPDVFSPILSSLADGQLHRIRIHREDKDLYVQVSIGHIKPSMCICSSICHELHFLSQCNSYYIQHCFLFFY